MAERHRWLKLRLHVYLCRKCGTGKVNGQRSNGDWVTTYHTPDGQSRVLAHVPPCEPGPLTQKFLDKYEMEIASAR